MISKKAQETTLVGLFITVIIVSIFTIFSVVYVKGGSELYNVPYQGTQFEQFDKSVNISSFTQQTSDTVTGSNSTSIGSNNPIEVITNAGYKSLGLISDMPAIYYTLFTGIGNIIGLPAEVVGMLFAVIVVMIISIIILLVFRVRV